MKTIEELLKEVAASKELQDELEAIETKDALEAFFRKNDCGATVEEFAEFIKSNTEGEISDSDAEAAAGGRTSDQALKMVMRDMKQSGGSLSAKDMRDKFLMYLHDEAD